MQEKEERRREEVHLQALENPDVIVQRCSSVRVRSGQSVGVVQLQELGSVLHSSCKDGETRTMPKSTSSVIVVSGPRGFCDSITSMPNTEVGVPTEMVCRLD